MPVGPKDAVGLHVHVHRIDSNAGVTLEGLLIAPVWHAGVQAADLIIVGYVEDLPAAVYVWKAKRRGHGGSFFSKQALKRIQEAVLTVGLAGVADPGEVLVAAAFVGAFGVVADVGAHSKLQTFVLI